MPEVSELTICADPKIKATPTITENAQPQGMRDVKAMNPTAQTAIVAQVVANVPVMNDSTEDIAVLSG